MSQEFDGGTDVINTPTLDEATTQTWLTWMWKNPMSGSSTARRIWERADATESFWWQDDGGGGTSPRRVRFARLFGGGTLEAQWQFQATLATHFSQWIPIIVRYDYSSAANDPSIRFAGAEMTLEEFVSPSGAADVPTGAYLIGNRPDLARPHVGFIAEWAKWNTLLSLTDVQALEAGSSPTGIAASSLRAYYRFKEDNASDPDLASNYANATYSGTVWNIDHPAVNDPAGGGDTTAPSAPTDFTATAASSSQINLSWTMGADETTIAANMRHLIEVSDDGSTGWVELITITGTTTTHQHTGLAASTQKFYRVSAIDEANNASGYATANATTTASGAGITLVEVRINGGVWQAATGTETWSFDLDVNTLVAGANTIEARSTDGDANVSTIQTQTIWYSPEGLYGAANVAGEHLVPLEINGYA